MGRRIAREEVTTEYRRPLAHKLEGLAYVYLVADKASGWGRPNHNSPRANGSCCGSQLTGSAAVSLRSCSPLVYAARQDALGRASATRCCRVDAPCTSIGPGACIVVTPAQVQEIATAATAVITAVTALITLWRRLRLGRRMRGLWGAFRRWYARLTISFRRRFQRKRSASGEGTAKTNAPRRPVG